MRIKLIHKISLGLIVVVGGLLLAVIVIVDSETTKAVESKIEKDLIAAKEVFENFRALRFHSLVIFNRTVADVPYLKAAVTTPDLDKSIMDKITTQVRENTESDLLLILNANRQVLAQSSSFEVQKVATVPEEVMAKVLKGEDYRGIWRKEGHMLQVVGSPFRMGEKVVGGLVSGHLISPSTIDNLQKMTNAKVIIFGPEHSMTSNAEHSFFQDLIPLIQGKGDQTSHEKLRKVTFENHEYLLWVSSFQQGTDLRYALVRLLDEELMFFHELRRDLFQAGAFIFLLFLFLGLWYSQRIIRPVHSLAKGAKSLARGEFTEPIKVITHDEIGDLAQSFNEMTGNLRESREDLVNARDYIENIIRSMIESLIVVNLDSTIKTVNEATCILLGYTQDELIQKPVKMILADKAFEKDGGIRGCLEKGNTQNVERIYLSKKGVEIPVSCSTSTMKDHDGNITGFVMVAQDVRKRKELEMLAMQSEKMAAVGKLASSISHEISNPIGTILGHAELLQRRIDGGNEKAKRSVAVILKEVNRCKKIIENLLSFSRIRKPEKTLGNLRDTLRLMKILLKPRLQFKRISLTVEVAESLPLIRFNETQIQQSILNICINAIDAMQEGGALKLRASAFQLRGKPWIRIEVADNGAGMTEEVKESIFDPFFTTKAIGKGTGLGLYLVQEIIKNHGGGIEIDSAPGEGTCFIITLPCEDSVPLAKGA